MERWTKHWMDMADLVAQQSKDPSTKVGAVLAKQKQLLGTGYNGFPATIEDKQDWYDHRPTKYAFVIHAELNAILNAFSQGHYQLVKGSTLHTTLVPCSECMKIIAAVGITRIIYKAPEERDDATAYHAMSDNALRIIANAGISVGVVLKDELGLSYIKFLTARELVKHAH